MGAGCRQQQETPAEAEEWAESPNFLLSPSSGVCDYRSMLGLTKILPSGGERLTRVVYRHPKTANFMNNLANRWCSGTMFNKIPSAAVAFAKLKRASSGNAEPEPVTGAASRYQTDLKPVETNAFDPVWRSSVARLNGAWTQRWYSYTHFTHFKNFFTPR